MQKTLLLHKIFVAWTLLLMASCTSDEWLETPGTQLPIQLSGVVDNEATPRVANNRFCDGDVMGVYIVDYKGSTPGTLTDKHNRATNVPHTYDEGNHKWNSAYDIYWKDNKTNIDIYGYYPYDTPSQVNAYHFSIKTNQSQDTTQHYTGGYEASDFLWGKAEDVAPTKKVIRLPMRHKMSKILVALTEGAGFEAGEWEKLKKQVLIVNTKHRASIDLATGKATALGDNNPLGIIPLEKGNEFHAIVVPQTIKQDTVLFRITVDGIPYAFKKKEDFTYNSGKMHRFTIKVDKKTLNQGYVFSVTGESIAPWEYDVNLNEEDAKEYIVVHVDQPGKLSACLRAAKKDYRKVKNMKITGTISPDDFYFMRDSMAVLQSLNIKEVFIKGDCDQEIWGSNGLVTFEDNEIPYRAFYTYPHDIDVKPHSLKRIILPDNLKGISSYAFFNCRNLTGSLIIPEGVEAIGPDAFYFCELLTGLYLPSTLKHLGRIRNETKNEYGVFAACGFTCDLMLPEQIEDIPNNCFRMCDGLRGELHLPSKLKSIGVQAFYGCHRLTGSLTIPHGVTSIPEGAFAVCKFNGTLNLHNGIKHIEKYAFNSTEFKGELILPENLETIGKAAFVRCGFSGTLKLPKSLERLGEGAFQNNYRLSGTVEIPEKITSLEGAVFRGCYQLEGIILPKNLERLRSGYAGTFEGCNYLTKIVSHASIPPEIDDKTFAGVISDNVIVEVPEASVQLYKSAPYWREFKRITAHHQLYTSISKIEVLKNQSDHEITLYAEGDWEIESKPDWCSLSQMSGNKKTVLTIHIDEMNGSLLSRQDSITFLLKDKEYTHTIDIHQYNSEHSEDQIITLQKATKGKKGGINLVFLGEGYNASSISSQTYMSYMKMQMENFFAIEPYKTYRDYFNVFTMIAMSPEDGIETENTVRKTRFNTTYHSCSGFECDFDALYKYVLQIPEVTPENLHETLIIVTPHTYEYTGNCHLWADGSAIAFCPPSYDSYPYDSRGIVQHVAGGLGFGKLGPENIKHSTHINKCPSCRLQLEQGKSLGWYENVSMSGKMHEVPWRHFIFDTFYEKYVDIYEGGFFHNRGVFRSETNSCMNNYIDYYNTISRESIVKRIKQYAGEEYSFEEFVANDKKVLTGKTRSAHSEHSPQNEASNRQSYSKIHPGSPLK